MASPDDRLPYAKLAVRALLMPAEHTLPFLAGFAVPGVLLLWLSLAWPGSVFIGASSLTYGIVVVVPDIAAIGTDPHVIVWVATFALFIGCLGFWQLGVHAGFARHPVDRLKDGVRRWPGYMLASVVQYLAPLTVYALWIGVVWMLIGRPSLIVDVTPFFVGLSWFVLCVLIVPATWIFGRLWLFPSFVVSDGWRRSLSRSWKASEPHQLGLALSCLVLFGIGLFGSTICGMVAAGMFLASGRHAVSLAIGGVNFVTNAMTFFWLSSFATLVAARVNPARDAIDPATFD